MAATNRDLEDAIHRGEFREDLYFRLNRFRIDLAPLSQRGHDVIEIAAHLMRKLQAELKISGVSLARDTHDLLLQHDWPGNIRELRNLIEGCLVMLEPGQSVITREFLECQYAFSGYRKSAPIQKVGTDLKRAYDRWSKCRDPERKREFAQDVETVIVDALEECNWKKRQAADRLGIARGTLYSYVKELGIGPSPEAKLTS